MKKNLLFASALLFVAPLFAQDEERPELNPATDPTVIFTQDFEADFDAWSTKEMGRIDTLIYYKAPYDISKYSSSNDGNNLSGKNIYTDTEYDFSIYDSIRTDSLIILYNGVVPTDNPDEDFTFNDPNKESYGLYKGDVYGIEDDGQSGDNVARQKVFDLFGTDGGSHYFFYNSGDTAIASTNNYTADSHVAKNYRRNLFVRGLEIDDETSYRLTAYVKVKKRQGAPEPTFYADVMRGYFQSEKPFSMGYVNNNSNYEYNNAFEYSKSDFKDDTWTKITFMTYYLNDSIANAYVFNAGYWWADAWFWTPEQGGDTLCYIVQPDRFFVRVGFASDKVDYAIDNISLTRSWIGGVEYCGNALRVDFGYETNLKDLTDKAKDETNIAAVELPGDYFTVYGKYKVDAEDSTTWEWMKVKIKSAEYQGDGYMYMWTVDDTIQGQVYKNEFEDYDSVLVSFTNPIERPDLRLSYNGKLFPKALDTEWIKNGKYVHDFVNEMATPNPHCVDNVFSMYNRPPVVQSGITAEFNSFQLDGTIDTMAFKMSKKALIDIAAGIESDYALLMVTAAGFEEFWIPKTVTDTSIVFQRPTGKQPLSGDYEFKVIHLIGEETPTGDDFVTNYSFGPANIPTSVVDYVNFNSYSKQKDASVAVSVPGFSISKCATRILECTGVVTRGLAWGIYGQQTGASADATNHPKLQYSVAIPADGNYDFEFGMTTGNGYNSTSMYVYLIDKDQNKIALYNRAGNLASTNASGSTEYKQKLSTSVNVVKGEASDVAKIDTLGFTANDLKAGNYTLSFEINCGVTSGWWSSTPLSGGYVLYYLEIVNAGQPMSYDLGISYGPMKTFDKAKNSIAQSIAAADNDADKYQGSVYEQAVQAQTKYAAFNANNEETKPSRWSAAAGELDAANKALNARMNVVDAMWAAYKNSENMKAEYDSLATVDGVAYSTVAKYIDLTANLTKFQNFICSDKTDDSIKAIQAILEADQKALTDRKAIMDTYRATLKMAGDTLLNADKSFAEYTTLNEIYTDYNTQFNVATALDDEITEATAALNNGVFTYLMAPQYLAFDKVYQKQLIDLATTLGVDFGANTTEVATLVTNNDARVETIYKAAIKAKVYEKLDAGEGVDSLPLNALIKNNELYSVALAGPTGTAYPVEHRKHKWNSDIQWYINLDKEYKDVIFPGWTVKAITNGGNDQVTSDDNKDYSNYSEGLKFFNGGLSMDWNSKAELTAEVEDLPVGLYQIGAYFYKNSGSNTSLAVNEQSVKVKNTFVENGVSDSLGNVGFDSVAINDGNLKIKVTLTSGNDWSYVDNFYIVLRGGATEASYENLANEANQAVDNAITFVDAASVEDADVTYYTIQGVKTQNSKAGVNIRVIEKDGKRVTQKVFVK